MNSWNSIGYDGDVNSFHSRLPDTIVNREIPPEVLAEVKEFLIQLEVERNETGGNLDESFESEDDDNNEDTGDEKKDDDFEVMMMMKFCKVFFWKRWFLFYVYLVICFPYFWCKLTFLTKLGIFLVQNF